MLAPLRADIIAVPVRKVKFQTLVRFIFKAVCNDFDLTGNLSFKYMTVIKVILPWPCLDPLYILCTILKQFPYAREMVKVIHILR